MCRTGVTCIFTFLHNSNEGMFLCLPEELYILSAFFVCHVHSVSQSWSRCGVWFGVGLESVWSRFGVGLEFCLELVWSRFGVGLELVWSRFEVDMELV